MNVLCGATEMNRQFLGQDFNLLDNLPVTAYDPTPLVYVFKNPLKTNGSISCMHVSIADTFNSDVQAVCNTSK